MRFVRQILLVAAILPLWLPPARAALIFSNLVSFVPTNGSNPTAGLVQATNGNFYGTTYYGGTNGGHGYGTVFRVSPAGVFSNLFSFHNTDGANPYGGLALGTNGNLYGTTESGGTNGYGTVFEISPAGAFTPLFSFNNTNGSVPEGTLLLASDGNFYGTTSMGGTNGGYGTVFKISHAGALTSLFSFNNTNGSTPYGALVAGTNGSFYGTTLYGGTNGGNGTVFSITPAGVPTTLHHFGTNDGANPYAGLIRSADGNFYGVASSGGASNNGTLFRMTPAGVLTPQLSFSGTNGASPYGPLIQTADGSFYGTTELGGTNNYGTVFKWSSASGLTSLVSFDFTTYGAFPFAGLTQGTDGAFYGTTDNGGLGNGTVYRLSAPVAPVFKTAAVNAGTMNLSWTSAAGQSYQLQFNSNVGQTTWTNIGPVVLATNGLMNATDAVPPPPSQRFYRVFVLP